jgi:hypothetical protein
MTLLLWSRFVLLLVLAALATILLWAAMTNRE